MARARYLRGLGRWGARVERGRARARLQYVSKLNVRAAGNGGERLGIEHRASEVAPFGRMAEGGGDTVAMAMHVCKLVTLHLSNVHAP